MTKQFSDQVDKFLIVNGYCLLIDEWWGELDWKKGIIRWATSWQPYGSTVKDCESSESNPSIQIFRLTSYIHICIMLPQKNDAKSFAFFLCFSWFTACSISMVEHSSTRISYALQVNIWVGLVFKMCALNLKFLNPVLYLTKTYDIC